jgi:(2S)-methylsuccinyl-CoA dehydrogenase
MAATLAACRALALDVARALARGDDEAQLVASQVKQVACRAAEWVTREAQQLHGGYGYAEEYTVSRLFVDARVLSIFEGADEVLAIRVIARGLVARAAAGERALPAVAAGSTAGVGVG